MITPKNPRNERLYAHPSTKKKDVATKRNVQSLMISVTVWHLSITESRLMMSIDRKAPFTRYNLLSNRLSIRLSNRFDNRLSNRFDNQLYLVYSRLTNRLYNPFDNRLNEQWLLVQPGWTNTGCWFNTVVKPDWQPVVSCKRGITGYCSDFKRVLDLSAEQYPGAQGAWGNQFSPTTLPKLNNFKNSFKPDSAVNLW